MANEDAQKEDTPEEIQKKIDKMGAGWKSGKTSMTDLTPEQRKRRLGLVPTEDQNKALKRKGHKK